MPESPAPAEQHAALAAWLRREVAPFDGALRMRRVEDRAGETRRIDAMERLIDWLPAHVPPQDSTSSVHGDFRLDNLVFHPTEPRIATAEAGWNAAMEAR